MKGLVSVILAALIAFPVRAIAEESGYPRVVERGDRVCLQRLAGDGQVVEECRDRVLAPGAPSAAEAPPVAPGPADEPAWIAEYRASMPRPARPAGTPFDVAKAQAAQDANGGAYLGGGIAGGCLLGLLGCGGVALLGMTSNPTPPDAGRWDNAADEYAYRQTYRDEVRSIRTRHALIGGAIGVAIVVGAVLVLVASTPNPGGG